MPVILGDALVPIRGDKAPLEKTLGDALKIVRERVGSIASTMGDLATKGFSKIGDAFMTVSKKFGESEGKIASFIGAAAQGPAELARQIPGLKILVAAIDATVGKYVSYADTVDQVSKATGASAEESSQLVQVLGQVGGQVDGLGSVMRPFNQGLAQMYQALQEGGKPSGDFAAAMEQMGFSLKDITDSQGNLLSMVDLLPQIVTRLQEIPAGAQRSAVEMALFGRNVEVLGDLLEKPAAEIEQMFANAGQSGMLLSEEDIAQAKELNQQWAQLNQQWQIAALQKGQDLVPTLNDALYGAMNLSRPDVDLGLLFESFIIGVDEAKAKAQEMRAEADAAARAAEQQAQAEARFASQMAQGYRIMALVSQGYSETEARMIAEAEAAEAAAQAQGTMGDAAQQAAGQEGQLAQSLGAAAEATAKASQQAILGGNAVASAWRLMNPKTSGGGGGVDVARQISDIMEQENRRRVDDARRAALEINQWYRDQDQWLADNAAQLTPELADEFRKRTDAAKAEADQVKDQDVQLAQDLLDAERQYQEEKLAIATDPSLSEEERAAKMEVLDREQSDRVGDLKAEAELEAQIRQENLQRQIEEARASGAAMGQAFVEALDPETMAQRLGSFVQAFDDLAAAGRTLPDSDVADFRS